MVGFLIINNLSFFIFIDMEQLKLKNEYLDSYISCPLSKKQELVRFIDKRLYTTYYNRGLSYLFEEIKINKEDVISEQPTDTTGSNS